MKKHLKKAMKGVLFLALFKAHILRADQCQQYLSLSRLHQLSAFELTTAAGQDFVTSNFSTWSYRANGCGAVCALNLVQGLRLQDGSNPLSLEDQAHSVYRYFRPDFTPGVFGYHGDPGEMKGLSTGQLALLIKHLLVDLEIKPGLQVTALQRFDHESLLPNQDIEFKKQFTLDDIVKVDDKTSKILLVSVSDLNKPPSHSYLTAHFYGVVKYENGVLFLHDPNIKNRVFKFRLVPYKSGPFESYQMIPLDSDYTIDRNFPPQLHYMINGLVTVEREN